MPTTILAPTYNAARRASPAFSIPKLSLANVLKVVKPPQNPVTNSSFIPSEITPLVAQPTNRPISKEPRMLTANVPHGKEEWEKHDMIYLHTEPTAPPRATRSMFFSIYIQKTERLSSQNPCATETVFEAFTHTFFAS